MVLAAWGVAILGVLWSAEPVTIQLAQTPAVAPDGKWIAFGWRGDIWLAASNGGAARQLTTHAGHDSDPIFSPDGRYLAFASDRDGAKQIYLMPMVGGPPVAITFHSEGSTPVQWTHDGKQILAVGERDHFWKAAARPFLVSTQKRSPEAFLFDAYGQQFQLSPDGKQVLFVREGERWWRKGYRGARVCQIWLHDRGSGAFTKVLDEPAGAAWPLWKPDGKAFYYVSEKDGANNLYEHDLTSNTDKQLTRFEDDGVVFPAIARDGSTIVFRRLFDLYRLEPGKGEPTLVKLTPQADLTQERQERRTLTKATQVAFSPDGLEVAFIAGGDLWVMDTVLREPVPLTRTGDEERDPVFSPSGDSILYVADRNGQSDIFRVERADAAKYWWRNDRFKHARLTNDSETEEDLKFSPAGDRIAFVRGRGDLCTMSPAGKDLQTIVPTWNGPRYQWSPDGKWFVYSNMDRDFNRDIYVIPSTGGEAINLSKDPDNEDWPTWSPDGKIIAYTARRQESEVDIHYVWLTKDDADRGRRDRTLEEAEAKISKLRSSASKKTKPAEKDKPAGEPAEEADKKEEAPTSKPKKLPEVKIDFDRIEERTHKIAFPHAAEFNLFWSPDGKKLAFSAAVENKRGTYTVEFPKSLMPKLLTSKTGVQPRWITRESTILWLSDGVPASYATVGAGKEEAYSFSVSQALRLATYHAAAFDQCWRVMRDRWYDESLGNRDWNKIREKYRPMAEQVGTSTGLVEVIELMLGELNGSHLGFRLGPSEEPEPGVTPTPIDPTSTSRQWRWQTAHLGVRFDPTFAGPGLKIKEVIKDGPADDAQQRLLAGDVMLEINHGKVGPETDLTTVLNGPARREVALDVQSADGQRRVIKLMPTSYREIRGLLYEDWIRRNRQLVADRSKGKLGYLHIQGMNMPSFYRFEHELYAAGAGKDGLIIDVRENGGGSTTDLLLTCLTQPVHAVTVPRGGVPGYPQDRMVYAVWQKPIVVLCNQNSYSNAEIFSHAIKTLGRGKVIGVPTAGGVVSTGTARIMDLGALRLPTRGWHVLGTGEDMELNGAVPDIIIWPLPDEPTKGIDRQLEAGVDQLLADVAAKTIPTPLLKKATDRTRKQ